MRSIGIQTKTNHIKSVSAESFLSLSDKSSLHSSIRLYDLGLHPQPQPGTENASGLVEMHAKFTTHGYLWVTYVTPAPEGQVP
jgi:hypothetical protein